MRNSLLILFFTIIGAFPVMGRLGETPAECRSRYGEPVTNYSGFAEVMGADVFVKDNIRVTTIYVKQTHGPSRAGVITYSNTKYGMQQLGPSKLSEDEEKQFLSLVPGRWEGYEAPEGLKGKPKDIISMSRFPTPLISSRDVASNAVNKVLTSLHPAIMPSAYNHQDLGHNGADRFAFRVANHVVVCTKLASEPARKWAEQLIADQEKARKKPERELKGF